MPMNGFSVGKDLSIDLVDPNTNIATSSFSLRTGFSERQLTSRVVIKGSDGIVRYLELPEGWEGELDYTRQNSAVDDYISGLETSYYAGLNNLTAQMTKTVVNPDMSISTFQFQGVVFKLTDGGTWNSDNEIKQKLGWVASLRVKLP